MIKGLLGNLQSTKIQKRSPFYSSRLLGGSGDLVTSYFYRLISLITPIRIPLRVLITLLNIYLLSPPTLQVGTLNPKLEALFYF